MRIIVLAATIVLLPMSFFLNLHDILHKTIACLYGKAIGETRAILNMHKDHAEFLFTDKNVKLFSLEQSVENLDAI